MCYMSQLGVLETEEASCCIFVICAFFFLRGKRTGNRKSLTIAHVYMFLTDGVDTLIRAVGGQLELFRFTESKKN